MNLPLGADGFYDLSPKPGGQDIHCSPDGVDSNDGLTAAAPVKTLNRARKLMRGGRPDRLLLLAGARFVDQQLWLDALGASPDAPSVVATYGGKGRAVIDVSAPVPTETAVQVKGSSGHIVLSDLELVCEAGKPGVRPHGKLELLAQNVLVRGGSLGWDMSEARAHLHRCVTLDVSSPNDSRSQGAYITKGTITITESVFDVCGWSPDRPMSGAHSGQNHCLYVDEDCPQPASISGSFFGRPCSHGLQLRTGGAVRKSVVWRAPIGGFFQGATGIMEDCYLEQQDANTLGQGTATGGDNLRGWGFDLEATHCEMSRTAFNRGGSARADSRAIGLESAKPGRSPPRAGPGLFVTACRVNAWPLGVRTAAPAADLGTIDVEVDGKGLRWPQFTVDPFVGQLRALERGGDWTLPARLAAEGYQSLEQVMPARTTRAALAVLAKAAREGAAAMESL